MGITTVGMCVSFRHGNIECNGSGASDFWVEQRAERARIFLGSMRGTRNTPLGLSGTLSDPLN